MKFIVWGFVFSILACMGNSLFAQVSSVAIIVDSKFQADLETEISRLTTDIQNDLSTSVIIHTVDVNAVTPEILRAYIKDLFHNQGLRGTILIGDIPAAKLGDDPPNPPRITDAFYQDLDDDCWQDPDGNGIYNTAIDENGDGIYDSFPADWIGERNREVWSGRLDPPSGVPLQERVELLRSYLDRDHLFRTGGISYKRGFIYSENTSSDDSATTAARAESVFEGSWLYSQANGDTLIQCQAESPVSRRNRWLDAIRDSVEYAVICVHGSTTGQWFGEASWLYSSDYRNSPANACVIDLRSCNNGDFSDPDYLAGWALFGGAALLVKANSTEIFAIGTPQPEPDQRLLSLGRTFGDLQLAVQLDNDSGTLFGDPTLKLRNAGTGPILDHDTSTTVLPTELAQTDPNKYQGGLVRLTNLGNRPLQAYLRIITAVSVNGKSHDMQCRYFLPEFKESEFFDIPFVIQPGATVFTPVTFYYEAYPPGDSSGVPAYLGKFRAKACLYTDSPSSPYFWLSFEKTVTPLVPDTAVLVSPSNNTMSQPVSLPLVWRCSPRATKYHVQLSSDSQFGSFVVNDSTLVDTLRAVIGLTNDTRYYWRVQAINSYGGSGFCGSFSFTTAVAKPGVPALISPTYYADCQPLSLTLRWSRVIGANAYQVQLSTDSTFAELVVNDSTVVDTTRLVTSLTNGMKYYWRVRAINAGGTSSYADPHSFTTIVALPNKLVLLRPANGARVGTDYVELAWRVGWPEIQSYELELIGDSTSSHATTDTSLTVSISTATGEKAYSWRVRAKNLAGFGTFSEVWTFIRLTTNVGMPGGIPKTYALYQNYPNPFNPTTRIRYALPTASNVTLTLYNTLGQVVLTVMRGLEPPGYHEVSVDGNNMASGVYIYRLQAGSFAEVRKLLLLK